MRPERTPDTLNGAGDFVVVEGDCASYRLRGQRPQWDSGSPSRSTYELLNHLGSLADWQCRGRAVGFSPITPAAGASTHDHVPISNGSFEEGTPDMHIEVRAAVQEVQHITW